MLQHRAQVLDVEQQQAGVVGDLERQVQHAFLRVVQLQQAREQQRPKSETVARIGCPRLPKTSQNTTGIAS